MKAWISKNLMWVVLSVLMSYNLYHLWLDPAGTWEKFLVNLHNPWNLAAFGFILLIPIVVGIALLYDKYVKQPKRDRFMAEWAESMRKSIEETNLMVTNEVPDDESISKYYKMYLKKFELDNEDEWTTHEPIPFDIWEEAAKADKPEGMFPRVRWQFMISMTSDAFMFSPQDGSSTMMRYRDYESMI